jgi:hypothetical protein
MTTVGGSRYRARQWTEAHEGESATAPKREVPVMKALMQREPRPTHIVSVVVTLDREVFDVVDDEAGQEALHTIQCPVWVEGVVSWFARPVRGTTMVVFTPVLAEDL